MNASITHEDRPSLNAATAPSRKSDGQDGPPVLGLVTNTNTPGALNSALKEQPKAGDGVDLNHPAAAHVQIVDRQAGIVVGTRKKIAICGFASSTRGAIPVNDPEWEVWGLNQLYRMIARADRWMDIHHNWESENVPGTDHRGWIRDCGIPVYMLEAHPDLPTAVRYPIERLIEKFGDYFTSTVALLLALATDEIDQRVDAALATETYEQPMDVIARARALYDEYTIGVFGIDLVVGDEYFWQKACAEYHIGIALGRGIRVMIPPTSALCRQLYRYGWHTEPNTIIKPGEVADHAKRVTSERDEGLKHLYMLEGALQVLNAPPDAQKNATEIAKQREETLKKLLMLEGALEADAYWNELLDLRLRGADVRV